MACTDDWAWPRWSAPTLRLDGGRRKPKWVNGSMDLGRWDTFSFLFSHGSQTEGWGESAGKVGFFPTGRCWAWSHIQPNTMCMHLLTNHHWWSFPLFFLGRLDDTFGPPPHGLARVYICCKLLQYDLYICFIQRFSP